MKYWLVNDGILVFMVYEKNSPYIYIYNWVICIIHHHPIYNPTNQGLFDHCSNHGSPTPLQTTPSRNTRAYDQGFTSPPACPWFPVVLMVPRRAMIKAQQTFVRCLSWGISLRVSNPSWRPCVTNRQKW